MEGLTNGDGDAQVRECGPHDGKEGSFGDSSSRVLGTKLELLVKVEERRECVFCAWTFFST